MSYPRLLAATRILVSDVTAKHVTPRWNRLVQLYNDNRTVRRLMDSYEDLIGVKEVKKSQFVVLQAEAEFIESSKARRIVQADLSAVQEQLKSLRQKLDSMSRGDEAYLDLITKEHQLLKKERLAIDELRRKEDTERDLFSIFSRSLRECQETEKVRQEKTKYLSLMGSLVGALLGILGTSINHAMKNKEMKKILEAIEASYANQEELVKRLQENNMAVRTAPISEHLTESDKRVSNQQEVPSTTPQPQIDMESLETLITEAKEDLEKKIQTNTLIQTIALSSLLLLTIASVLFSRLS